LLNEALYYFLFGRLCVVAFAVGLKASLLFACVLRNFKGKQKNVALRAVMSALFSLMPT